MQTDNRPPPLPRLSWVFFALLGLITGPLVYAWQTGDRLAFVGYAALGALWYAYGRASREALLYRLAVYVLADRLAAIAPPGRAAPAALPPPDGGAA